MKKAVALILSASMLLGLAACSESEETKKKKKKRTKKTATTEITEIETETEVPSDSDTIPTDTDPTDTLPTDTDPIGLPADITIKNDLSQLLVERDPKVRMYGAIDPTQDIDYGEVVASEYLYLDELLLLDQDGDAEKNYQKALTALYAPHDDLERKFDDYLKRFYDKQKNGQSLPNEVLMSPTTIFRCDTQIMSIAMTNVTLVDGSAGDARVECHNFRASDGSRIENSDVIKNPDALKQYLEDMYPEDGFVTDGIIESIGSAEPNMVLSYDGVIFPEHSLKVPYTDVPEAFDESYFFSTPDVYSLYLDTYDRLVWDFDGDGDIEKLDCDIELKDYLVSSIKIELDGNTYEFTGNEIPTLGYTTGFKGYLSNAVSFTDHGTYLFLTLEKDFLTDAIFVFRITSNGIEYINELQDTNLLEIYDPTHMMVEKNDYVLNLSSMFGTYSLLDDGSLSEYSVMQMMFSGPYVTKQDLKVNKVYEDSIGGEIWLKAGTPVGFWMYDPYQGSLLMKVLTPYEEKCFLVYAQIDEDEGTINGKPLTEVFAGFRYDY